jgi:hypothetical protein
MPPMVTHSEPCRLVPAGQEKSGVGAAVFVLVIEQVPFTGALPSAQTVSALAAMVMVLEQLLPDSR